MGLGGRVLLLVIEVGSQAIAEKCQGWDRVLAVPQQHLAIFDFAVQSGRRPGLQQPLFQDRVDFGVLLLVLQVQAIEVEVAFGAGDECCEWDRAIWCEREVFEEGDFACGGWSGDQQQDGDGGVEAG